MFFVLTFQYHYTHPAGFVKRADDQSLPLRGRWQREALAEGETSRCFLSPSRLRRQPPHRGGLAALSFRASDRVTGVGIRPFLCGETDCRASLYPKGTCFAARTGAAIRFPARQRRADGTSYPKGICSAALHCRTPSPTLGLPHLSVGRDPCVPPQNTAFVPAGHTGPALQGGSTDSRRKKRKPLRAFFFCI